MLGQVRTSVGKAQLLVAQRFKQFSELVDNCELGTGEKTITCQDLQGFWDMIYFQVRLSQCITDDVTCEIFVITTDQ